MKHNEESLQTQCVTWFRLQYKEPKHLIFAIPNGGKRNKFEAYRLKKSGVRAGVPDLFVCSKGKKGIFIEMKTDSGSLTLIQKNCINMLDNIGYSTTVVKSFEQFQSVIKDYING